MIFLVLTAGGIVLSFRLMPPFGQARVAQVLLVGLDDKPREGGTQRSDSIILTAVHVQEQGTTLLAVPRDARVRLAGTRGHTKINAAYARGGITRLKETLADPAVLGARLPYHLVFDSGTVAAMVDALGGITVTVPFAMDYDDNWGNLHIHLKPGRQKLDGEQAVGYLRWRKNNSGHGPSGDDIARSGRQRDVLIGLARQVFSWEGVRRMPAAYKAWCTNAPQTNLTTRQMILLGWRARPVTSAIVPGTPIMRRGISFLDCDWVEGRRLWQAALE